MFAFTCRYHARCAFPLIYFRAIARPDVESALGQSPGTVAEGQGDERRRDL